MPVRRLVLAAVLLTAAALPVGSATAAPAAGERPGGPGVVPLLAGAGSPGDDVGRAGAVRADLGALFTAPAAGGATGVSVALGEAEGVALVARLGPALPSGAGFRARAGSLAGEAGSAVVLASDGTTLAGSVTSSRGSWRIRSRGPGRAVLEPVPAWVLRTGDIVRRSPAATRARRDALRPAGSRGAVAPASAPATGALPVTVTLLVPYTDATVAFLGGAAAVRAEISTAVALTNRTFVNSGLPLRVRLVGTMQVPGDIRADDAGLDRATRSPAIAAVRTRTAADLVSVFAPTNRTSCGVAWLNTVRSGDPAGGYSVVDAECAGGQLTLAHEIGHNLGGAHDRYSEPSDEGLLRPWAHGFVDRAHSLRTVMAYPDDGCADGQGCRLVPYWSDPARRYAGHPLGVARHRPGQAHDAAVLAETAPVVAGYRRGPVRPVPPTRGDHGGDDKADLAVFRPSTATWHVRRVASTAHGLRGDLPAEADFTGDRRTDLAVFRPATGTWYVRGAAAVRHGVRGDVAVPADYDGDGRAEIAVYRPSTGTWYVRGRAAVRHGVPGDVAVPADYDGDLDADLAVFRPSTGTWYVRGRAPVRFGVRGDVALPADHTGDRRAEPTVYRPSTGTWYVRGVLTARYGLPGDRPR